MKMKSQNGFTMVELLVCIAIIGILAAISIANFQLYKEKARDTARLQDIHNIQTAMEAYYAGNERYPSTGGAGAPNGAWSNSGDGSWATLETVLGMPLPRDPINTAGGWATGANVHNYAVFSHPAAAYCSNQAYMVVAKLESGDRSRSTGVRWCDGVLRNYGGTITVGSGRN